MRAETLPAPAEEHRGGSLSTTAHGLADQVDDSAVSAGAAGTAHVSDLEIRAAQQANNDAQPGQTEGQLQRRQQRRLMNRRRAQRLSEQRAQQREQHRQQRLRLDADLLRVIRRAPPLIADHITATGATDELRQRVQGMGDETAKVFISGLGQLIDSLRVGPTAIAGAACAAVGSGEASQGDADDTMAEQPPAPGKHAAKNRRRRQRNRQRRLAMEQQH